LFFFFFSKVFFRGFFPWNHFSLAGFWCRIVAQGIEKFEGVSFIELGLFYIYVCKGVFSRFPFLESGFSCSFFS